MIQFELQGQLNIRGINNPNLMLTEGDGGKRFTNKFRFSLRAIKKRIGYPQLTIRQSSNCTAKKDECRSISSLAIRKTLIRAFFALH